MTVARQKNLVVLTAEKRGEATKKFRIRGPFVSDAENYGSIDPNKGDTKRGKSKKNRGTYFELHVFLRRGVSA
ncbi:hypothetical protein SPSIL_057720 [Sporomusa silvacetica DSM 10669]|uniref:Uncharacterized protein n=1 Tax=Sporomusa silvacetica DSM 10669 TaxID=1123289 RepID=A0ABZ3IVY7_9FIRM|nr:hypothetical protein SPSIL_50070 [Sporomusa silvacetica DSM 10669]